MSMVLIADCHPDHNGTQEITIEEGSDEGSIEISAKGFAPFGMDEGPIIMIELYEGDLRLIVWKDINAQDPHVIDLGTAKLERRLE